MGDAEIWRCVPSVPGLMASSWGRLMVLPKSGSGRNANKTYGGLPQHGVWDGKRFIYRLAGKTHRVARLICEAFHGAPTDATNVCMHLDECSSNNRSENLRWGTQKENLNFPRFIAYCKSRTGENHPSVKARRNEPV